MAEFVTGLDDALDLLVRAAAPSADPIVSLRRAVRATVLPVAVYRVRVCDAGALFQLLTLRIAGPEMEVARVIPNRVALHCVADCAELLHLLRGRFLEGLRLHPTDATRLRLLDASALKLRVKGAGGGGSIDAECTYLASLMDDYSVRARQHPVASPYAPLRRLIDNIADAADHLFHRHVTVMQAPEEDAAEVDEAIAEVEQLAEAHLAAMELAMLNLDPEQEEEAAAAN